MRRACRIEDGAGRVSGGAASGDVVRAELERGQEFGVITRAGVDELRMVGEALHQLVLEPFALAGLGEFGEHVTAGLFARSRALP